jgi:hypothetical protein
MSFVLAVCRPGLAAHAILHSAFAMFTIRFRRFFLHQTDYLLERGFYDSATFAQCMPQLMHADDNAKGTIVSRSGYRFPPFLVLDRGVTLTQWLDVKRFPSAMWAMAAEVLELLALLHQSGSVHRDLKPENVLFIFHTQQWRLLDFGIAANVGMDPLSILISMLFLRGL